MEKNFKTSQYEAELYLLTALRFSERNKAYSRSTGMDSPLRGVSDALSMYVVLMVLGLHLKGLLRKFFLEIIRRYQRCLGWATI